MSGSIIAVWDILVKALTYYLTDSQDFSGCYFTETLLFFPYHGISCNFSNICFILGFIFTWKKVLLHEFQL